MSEIVELVVSGNRQELRVKEYSGQRVVTFREIDDLHRRSWGTSARNFRENRGHFREGKDFYSLAGADAYRFATTHSVGTNPAKVRELILITKSGYLMLVKSLNDDLAWEVQRQLVATYFDATTGALDVPKNYAEALRLAANLWEENQEQKATLAVMAPKAEFHDAVASSEDAQPVGYAAKVLGTGQNRLFARLRGEGILMDDNRPYQQYLNPGYFRVIEQTWTDSAGNVHLTTKTLVTGKGLAWLQKRLSGGMN